MKTQYTLSKGALSLILAFTCLSGCQSQNKENEQQKFDEFMKAEFVDTLENSFLDTHIALEKPEDFGINIDDITVSLGSRYDEEAAEEARKITNETWDKFNEFNRKLLNEDQQDTYDIYKFQIENALALNDEKFAYYGSMFETMGGIHAQLPTMFADWVIRNEKDIQNLITLINDTKPYIDSILEYTKTQEEKGLLMIDLDAVIEHCEGILKSGENSSILSDIYQNIDTLNLNKETADKYKTQLKEAYINSFIPAYEEIIKVMTSFYDKNNNEEGLSHFEYGKEYYEILFKKNIGSDKSIEDIKKMMKEKCREHLLRIMTIANENPEALEKINETSMTGFKSYEEILDYISNKMIADYPPVKDLRYNIRNVNEELATSGIAAYFQVPAIDSSTPKQLRVNPTLGNVSSIDVYSTVSHEGYPGHMYQYGYAYENLNDPYRKILSGILPYTEGFAVYSSYFSFNYLKERGIDPTVYELFKENELATYCMVILADIGIHYEGWSIQDFQNEMYGILFTSKEVDENTEILYKQLQANPCAFEPYYVGYYEFMDLREKAQSELGNDFKDIEFHEAILESGNAPFDVVERHVDEYIKETK